MHQEKADTTALTDNDTHVLNALFDPETSLSSGVKVDPDRKHLPHTNDDTFDKLQEREAHILKPLAVEKPDTTTIRTAVASLTELIGNNPEYAPAYANRAQACRLMLGDQRYSGKDAGTAKSVMESVMQDLSKAIALASPNGGCVDEAISPSQQKILSSAYTHRAYLFYTIAKSGDLSSLPDSLQALGAERLEDMASVDFQMGGRYGNQIAQQMSVRTNPYAKMCGAIVKEALGKEMDAEPAIPIPVSLE